MTSNTPTEMAENLPNGILTDAQKDKFVPLYRNNKPLYLINLDRSLKEVEIALQKLGVVSNEAWNALPRWPKDANQVLLDLVNMHYSYIQSGMITDKAISVVDLRTATQRVYARKYQADFANKHAVTYHQAYQRPLKRDPKAALSQDMKDYIIKYLAKMDINKVLNARFLVAEMENSGFSRVSQTEVENMLKGLQTTNHLKVYPRFPYFMKIAQIKAA